MVKYISYSIVFSEVPNEVTLAFQITNCPFRCDGCHSPYLQTDCGIPLVEDLDKIVQKYKNRITCVCFMGEGGENYPTLRILSKHIKEQYNLKTALYTGFDKFILDHKCFDYIKLGPYEKDKGPINVPTTNQHMWQYIDNEWKDITYKFWQKGEVQ